MKKLKKKLTSNEDFDDSEIPLKRQNALENSMNELSICGKTKKRKKASKSTNDSIMVIKNFEFDEDGRVHKKKKKIETNSTITDKKIQAEDLISENDGNILDTKLTAREFKDKKYNKANVEKVQLTGKSIRGSFQAKDSFDALRKFVSICNENKNQDLAAEYLEEGGHILEILRTFEAVDKNNLNNYTILFSAINILIMKILGRYSEDSKEYLNAIEDCKRILNTHMPSIQSMLSNQSNAKQRKVVFKMLTAMVTMGETLPRDILINLPLNTQVLDAVVRHTKPKNPDNVRTSFIHFILAVLVDSRNSVIRSLLDKRDVLTSIFPDLIYDSHDIVNLVLTTVKKYILENPAISKTTKLHIFSTPVVQSLVNLYNWKGPRNWPGLKKEKEKKKVEEVDPEEKEIAVEALHNFLITLLTSKKFGIVFQNRALGLGEGRKSNQLVNTVLKSLDRPWEHDKPCDLVVQILRACPDLIKSQIGLTEPFLAPKVSMKWIKLIRFLNQVIKSIEIEKCFQDTKNLSEMSIEQFSNTVINLILPTIVLRQAVAPALLQSNISIRHESVLLFTTMLNQAKKFISLLESSYDSVKFRKLNNHLIEYMADNAPVFERCLQTIKKTMEPSESGIDSIEEIEIPQIEESLLAIINLLKAYYESFPALAYVNHESDVNLTILLTGLSKTLDTSENFQSDFNVIAIEFLLTLNPFIFTPAQEFYGKSLLFLLMALDEKSPLLANVKSSIIKLLEVPRAFYECEDQIEIWFNAFLGLKEFEERLEIALWFIKIVGRIFKDVEKYHLAIKEAEESAGIEIDKYMSFFEGLRRNGAYYVKNYGKLQYVTSLPLVLCPALESIKKKPTETLIRFMNEILMHTLYYQVKPEPLIHLTRDIKELKLEH